ncbi:DNA polymerase III subunit beta [Lactococcus lactis]|uniref:DNA polymerase III subunit beta n=1 Tax=Lactococcus lactis TaxID=1358 RepID=UPI00071E4E64|nr:DNA polymerase III subunit beta [Lactococcus lactis]KST81947.1 DNA polymerase III beta subunit [Lactococcus lactis subsp. lactis]
MEVGTYQMKIIINQQSLLAALNKMNAFLRSSEMLTLSTKSTSLYLFGKSISTNISSEIKLTTKTEETGLEIKEKSTIQVNFGAFIKAIRESERGILEIKTSNAEDLRLVISSSEFEIDIFAKNTEYRPGFVQGQKVGKFESESLSNLFKEVTYSISKLESRPLFNHVHFKLKDNQLLIEATDARCMARYAAETSQQTEFDLLIPEIVSKKINKFFGKEGIITIELHDTEICFKSKGMSIEWELYDKEYPDTQRLIPDRKEMTSYEFNAKSFKSALRRMIKLSDGGDDNTTIRLEFSENTVQLITDNFGFSLFNYHQELPLLSEGKKITLGVNPNYILNAINHLPKGSEVVKLVVLSEIRPFIVESEISSNTLHLATPIRMN